MYIQLHVYNRICLQYMYIINSMHKTELFVALFAGVTSIPWAQAPGGYFIPQLYS